MSAVGELFQSEFLVLILVFLFLVFVTTRGLIIILARRSGSSNELVEKMASFDLVPINTPNEAFRALRVFSRAAVELRGSVVGVLAALNVTVWIVLLACVVIGVVVHFPGGSAMVGK